MGRQLYVQQQAVPLGGIGQGEETQVIDFRVGKEAATGSVALLLHDAAQGDIAPSPSPHNALSPSHPATPWLTSRFNVSSGRESKRHGKHEEP